MCIFMLPFGALLLRAKPDKKLAKTTTNKENTMVFFMSDSKAKENKRGFALLGSLNAIVSKRTVQL